MSLSNFAIGTVLSFLCSICFGSQTSFAKVPSVTSCKIRMEIFNIYFVFGVATICLLSYLILVSILQYTIVFSSMGLISAALLYCGELFTLLAVQQIGVAYGTALSVLASAVTGIIIQHILGQHIQNYLLTIFGLLIVSISVICGVFLKHILAMINCMDYHNTEKSILIIPTQESVINILSETQPLNTVNESETHLIQNDNTHNTHFTPYTKKMILGFVYASIAGCCYCTVPLPSLYVESYAHSSGIKFSLSFGVGCLVVLPLSFLNVVVINPFHKETALDWKNVCWKLITFEEDLWHFKSAAWCGIGAGCVWGIGNLMGICTFLYLDYVIVTVYVQFHMIVSLLWGICLWKEITQTIEMIALSVLTLSLIGGCIMVTFGVY